MVLKSFQNKTKSCRFSRHKNTKYIAELKMEEESDDDTQSNSTEFTFEVFDGTGANSKFADFIHEGDESDEEADRAETEYWVGCQGLDSSGAPSEMMSKKESSNGDELPKGKKGPLTPYTLRHKCLKVLQQLIDDPHGQIFRDAVDPDLVGLDYFKVVNYPMHLLLVKKKLKKGVYANMASFERDVKMVFKNAILYNGERSDVGILAKTMQGVFEAKCEKVFEDM